MALIGVQTAPFLPHASAGSCSSSAIALRMLGEVPTWVQPGPWTNGRVHSWAIRVAWHALHTTSVPSQLPALAPKLQAVLQAVAGRVTVTTAHDLSTRA